MCVFHMENFHLFATYPHGYHVDPVLDSGPPVSGHPDQCGTPELLELIEVDGADRTAKVEVASCFDLDERDRLAALDYEIQVPMAVLEPMLQHPPAMPAQPFRGDAFAVEAKELGIGEHGLTLATRDARAVIAACSMSSQGAAQRSRLPRGVACAITEIVTPQPAIATCVIILGRRCDRGPRGPRGRRGVWRRRGGRGRRPCGAGR